MSIPQPIVEALSRTLWKHLISFRGNYVAASTALYGSESDQQTSSSEPPTDLAKRWPPTLRSMVENLVASGVGVPKEASAPGSDGNVNKQSEQQRALLALDTILQQVITPIWIGIGQVGHLRGDEGMVLFPSVEAFVKAQELTGIDFQPERDDAPLVSFPSSADCCANVKLCSSSQQMAAQHRPIDSIGKASGAHLGHNSCRSLQIKFVDSPNNNCVAVDPELVLLGAHVILADGSPSKEVIPVHIAGLSMALDEDSGETIVSNLNWISEQLFRAGSVWLVKEPFFTVGVNSCGQNGIWCLKVDSFERTLFPVVLPPMLAKENYPGNSQWQNWTLRVLHLASPTDVAQPSSSVCRQKVGKVLTNLALCCKNLENPLATLGFALFAVAVDPSSQKGLYRLAEALARTTQPVVMEPDASLVLNSEVKLLWIAHLASKAERAFLLQDSASSADLITDKMKSWWFAQFPSSWQPLLLNNQVSLEKTAASASIAHLLDVVLFEGMHAVSTLLRNCDIENLGDLTSFSSASLHQSGTDAFKEGNIHQAQEYYLKALNSGEYRSDLVDHALPVVEKLSEDENLPFEAQIAGYSSMLIRHVVLMYSMTPPTEEHTDPLALIPTPKLPLLSQQFSVQFINGEVGRGLFKNKSSLPTKVNETVFSSKCMWSARSLGPTRVHGRKGERREGSSAITLLSSDCTTDTYESEVFVSWVHLLAYADLLNCLELRCLKPQLRPFLVSESQGVRGSALSQAQEYVLRATSKSTTTGGLLPLVEDWSEQSANVFPVQAVAEEDQGRFSCYIGLGAGSDGAPLKIEDLALEAISPSLQFTRAVYLSNAFEFNEEDESHHREEDAPSSASSSVRVLWTMGALMNHSTEEKFNTGYRPAAEGELNGRKIDICHPSSTSRISMDAIAVRDIAAGHQLLDRYYSSIGSLDGNSASTSAGWDGTGLVPLDP